VNVRSDIDRDGFAVCPGVLTECSCLELQHDVDKLLEESPAGVRGLAAKVHGIGDLAQSASVRSLVDPVLGANAQLVRSILFNKSDETNWQVAWHQDLAIAVTEKVEVEGYSSWSVKEGVPHVHPPEEILQQMLTVRLHLDAADETNGALWVSPRSHRFGRLRAAEAAAVAERNGKHLCVVRAGGALLMRPLILHASRKATTSLPRRVVHLEFAGAELPRPLAWAEAATRTRK
jgi:ectoine hydroxylase-related dioxygenase (phytanoyl-CoA dioxygenase family)